MDVQLRDEAAQDRLRAATEFLDPSEFCFVLPREPKLTCFFDQSMHGHAGLSSRMVSFRLKFNSEEQLPCGDCGDAESRSSPFDSALDSP